MVAWGSFQPTDQYLLAHTGLGLLLFEDVF